MSFIVRAFTPPGGEAPEAVAQREAAQVRINQEAAAKAAQPPPTPPTMPTIAPPSPPVFQPGQAPGQKQRAAATTATMLGAAAAAGQTTKKTLLGQ